MSKQFNVGDTVRYNSTNNYLSRFWSEDGVVFEVDTDHTTSRGTKEVCYSIRWKDGSTNCMYLGDGLELVKSAVILEPTIKSAKELKAELESKILWLIQDFNKKTCLQIKDVDVDRERTLGGDCFYMVNVRVEI